MTWGKTLAGVAEPRAFRGALVRTVGKFSVACLLLLPGPSSEATQRGTHRCEVSLEDFNTDNIHRLGGFTTVVKSESLVTKAFRFPGSELFVSASVLYMQDSPYAENAPASKMILTLALSTKPYSNIETEMRNAEVVTNARTIVPLKSFESAEVETIFLGKPQPVIIVLKCKK